MTIRYLTLPGYQNSGPHHWQTLWEKHDPKFFRIDLHDWNHPHCAKWVETLERTVSSTGKDIILVAHSLGCLLVAHWAARTHLPIQGAFLVAPPDPTRPDFPRETSVGFDPVPLRRFSFSSILVASTNDPFGSLEFATDCAQSWGSRLVNIGATGHINAESNLGMWPEGQRLLTTLVEKE